MMEDLFVRFWGTLLRYSVSEPELDWYCWYGIVSIGGRLTQVTQPLLDSVPVGDFVFLVIPT